VYLRGVSSNAARGLARQLRRGRTMLQTRSRLDARFALARADSPKYSKVATNGLIISPCCSRTRSHAEEALRLDRMRQAHMLMAKILSWSLIIERTKR